MNDTDRDINLHVNVTTPYDGEDFDARRPTVHNPTHFEPSDYVVEDYLDNKRPEFFGQPGHAEEVTLWEADMERALGASWRAKAHHCVHCGNGTVRWITAVTHKPTGERVVFGAVCTDRLGFANKHAFKLAQLQARAEARKVRFTTYTKRTAFIAANPGIASALAHIDDTAHVKNFFVRDVLAKLDQYGSLSEKQVTAVVTSMVKDLEYAVKREAEASGPVGPAPSGRVEVTGEVLSTKWVENDFGTQQKMLVKLENNAKVWLTVPSRESIERGNVVTFKATFEVSKDDPTFAFGKRPHVSKVVR